MSLSILSIILLLNFVLLIFLAIKLTLIERGNLIFQLASVTMLSTACLTLLEFGIMLTGTKENIIFYSQLTQVLQLSVSYIALISTLFFCKPFSDANQKYLKAGLALFGIPFLYLSFHILSGNFSMIINSVEKNHIWYHQIKTDGFQVGLFFFWILSCASIIILSFISAYLNETNQRKKNWFLYLSFFQFLNTGTLVIVFLLYSQNSFVPFLTSIPLTFSAILMSWTFSNFQLFKINPASAFDNIVENMSNLVIITDTNFLINFTNKTALDYLSINTKKLQNRPIDILRKNIDISDITRLKEQCAHLGRHDFFQEELLLTIEGQSHHFQFNFSPIYNQQNRKTGYLLLGNDLTYYKSSTAQLEEQTQMLEESNMELERFAYIASHDLKTPLRNVVSFLNLIERKMEKYQDKELQDFIGMARQGADQMYTLIQDVLEYSQLKKINSEPQKINLNHVMQKVINNLGEALYKNNLDISIDHLPVIKVQEAHIIQVFQNLIENGLKYNENKNPRVQVIYHNLEDQHLFEIKDNGIGIDLKYQNQIFEMFKRLHNSTEYSGSGIGLAICKKIIQANDGRIWLASEEGKGSSFFFSWPISESSMPKKVQQQFVELD